MLQKYSGSVFTESNTTLTNECSVYNKISFRMKGNPKHKTKTFKQQFTPLRLIDVSVLPVAWKNNLLMGEGICTAVQLLLTHYLHSTAAHSLSPLNCCSLIISFQLLLTHYVHSTAAHSLSPFNCCSLIISVQLLLTHYVHSTAAHSLSPFNCCSLIISIQLLLTHYLRSTAAHS
jgi:hypothetical protein